LAYRAGLPQADPVLLEPIDKLMVHIPDDSSEILWVTSTSVADASWEFTPIRSRGIRLSRRKRRGAEIAKYATDLKSMTQGRGWFTIDFVRYEQVPQNISERIIAAAQSEE